MVVKATTACFSDMVRVAGYLVPRRMAVVNVESDGYKVTEVLVAEGDQVTVGQVMARLTRPASEGERRRCEQGRPAADFAHLRAPASGLVTRSTARVREMASPQAEPLFQILVDNEVELEAEIPSIHVSKLRTGEIARISVSGGAERAGRVRLVAPEIDQKSQLGKVRVAVGQRCVAADRDVRPRHDRRQAQLRRRYSAQRGRLRRRGHQRAALCATGPSRCGGWSSDCCRTTASRSARASTRATRSSPTPAPRCTMATRSGQ